MDSNTNIKIDDDNSTDDNNNEDDDDTIFTIYNSKISSFNCSSTFNDTEYDSPNDSDKEDLLIL